MSPWLEQRFDCFSEVGDIFSASLQVAVAVYEEVAGQALHVVEGEHVALQSLLAIDADPGQCLASLLPEMFAGIQSDLIDFEALVVIPAIEFSQEQRSFRASVQGKCGEIEQNDVSAQAAECPLLTVDVRESHVDDAQFPHFVAVDVEHNLTWFCSVLPAFQYDVAEVLGAWARRVFLVPCIGHRLHPGQVALVVHRIEYEACAKRLETSVVAVGCAVVPMQEILLHLCFVFINEQLNHAVPLLDGEVAVCRDAACFSLQAGQFQAEEADGVARSAPLNNVAERHIRYIRLDANRLRAVYTKVDALPSYAKSVELGAGDTWLLEMEGAVLRQPDAVDGDGSLSKGKVLQIEHQGVGSADVAFDAELFLLFASAKQREY